MTKDKVTPKIKSLEDLPVQFYLQMLTELHNCIITLRKAFINVPGEHGKFFSFLADGVMDKDYKQYIMLTQALQLHLDNSDIDQSRESNKEEQEFVDSLMDNLIDFHKTLNKLDDDAKDDLLESVGFGDELKPKRNEVRNEA